jgi:hypothetical protein
MPGHYGMSFGERGRGSSAAADARAMEQHMANVFADPGPSQAEVDRANRQNAAIAATVRMEQQAEADRRAAAAAAQVQANIQAAAQARARLVAQQAEQQAEAERQAAAAQVQANIEAAAREQARRAAQAQAMTVGTPEMGFTEAMGGATGVSPGGMFARYGANAPAVMRFAEAPTFGGLSTGVLGALGFGTAQSQLQAGTGQPVMDASGRVRGALSTGPFGSTVYSGTPIPGYEGPYSELIAPSVDMSDDQPEVTSTVTNPATGREECPEGYIFDEDLNACRLDTRGGTTTAPDAPAAPGVPGAQYARTGLLDVAPEGLMGFQERYGAGFGTPADFGAANLAFRQQGAISPEYYQTPPKLTGYTLLG